MPHRQTPQHLSPPSLVEPFLRWAGSKRKLLPILTSFWSPNYVRYVEPFMGSACLFFRLQPSRALLSDINEDLTITFNTVRDHPKAVAARLSEIRLGKRSYYSIRGKRVNPNDAIGLAARFIFLNRFCFNGLYRTNTAGAFNVPYASTGTGKLPSEHQLIRASTALKQCNIDHRDFEETLAQTRAGDFVYLDPPYAVGNRRVFRQYGPSSFGLADLQRLSTALLSMNRRGVRFVLSYAHCAEALEYFDRWPRRRTYVQRNIAGFAAYRKRAGEVLFSNCFPKSDSTN